MNITWHGQTCFKIGVQKAKDGSVNILIDPFEKEIPRPIGRDGGPKGLAIGLRPPKMDAEILLFTGDSKKGGEGFLIEGPGEYDMNGIYIQGIPASTKKEGRGKTTIYVIEAEDIKICHLGNLGRAELSSKELEEIGDVDILMIPVGGLDSLDAKEAIKIMSQIEPKITIPMYYKIPGLKLKLDGLDKFLGALGIKKLESLPKLSIKKKEIPEEEVKIIVLQP